MDETAAATAVGIQITLQGRELARVEANEFRDDLLRRGIGNGHHGFTALFAEKLPDELRAAVEFRAVDAAGHATVLPARQHSRPLGFSNPQDPYAHPVFVLGSPRSGTSAITAALLKATRYEGHSEGHLLPLLPILTAAVAKYYDTLSGALEHETTLATVPQGYFEARLGQICIDIMRARFATPYWLDKTPSNYMIIAARQFAELWPNARFIFMKRRGIENMVSRMQKFPTDTFERQCRDWCDAMFFWTRTRDRLGANAIEIDQMDLARQPQQVAAKLSRLLDLSTQDRDALQQAITGVRVEQTSSEIGWVTSLDAVEWTAEQKTRFREICGAMMAAYGYSEGKDYFSQAQAA
jgi:hypothetical protein